MSVVWQPIAIPSGAFTPPDDDSGASLVSRLVARASQVTAATAAMLVAIGTMQAREELPAGSFVIAPPIDEAPQIIRPWPAVPPRPFWAVTDATPVSSATPARGPAMAATLRFTPEAGGQITYSWNTNIMPSRSGYESRIALVGAPRESYDFSALLSDLDFDTLQSQLIYNQAAGAAFGVALVPEALVVTGGSGKTVNVGSTAYSDWAAIAGQTAIVIAPDGVTTGSGVVQSFTSGTVTLDTDVSAAAVPGALIMPVIPSWLDTHQGFGLYPVNAETYALKARAAYFGNATGDWSPRGASVTTYTDSLAVTRSVWDRGIVVQGTSPRVLVASTTLVDRGGALAQVGSGQPVVNVARQLLYTFTTDADRQWLKAFHGAVQGRQKAFLAPTCRPDLVVASGDASGGTVTTLAKTDYAGQWTRSAAHKWLQFQLTSGAVAYRTVTDQHDNGDGTQTLQLDSAVVGAIAMVSFLELCRLDSDDIVVQYDGGMNGTCRIPAMVVQQ